MNMTKVLRLPVVAMFPFLAFSMPVSGQMDAGTADRSIPVFVSSSRRIVIRNIRDRDAAVLSRMLEQTIAHVESLSGRSLDIRPMNPIIIRGRELLGAIGGGVLRRQGGTRGQPAQALDMMNPASVSWPELEEAFTWLLLNRIGMSGADAASTMPETADWLAAGLTIWMDPARRDAASDLAARAWRASADPDVRDLVLQRHLPEGPWAGKAWSCMVLRFLFDGGSPGYVLEQLAALDWLGPDDEVAAAVASLYPAASSMEELERYWDLYLADLSTEREAARVTLEEKLSGLLVLSPAEFGPWLQAAETPPRELADLIPVRDREWAAQLARVIATRLQALAVQADPEAEDVVNLYTRFLSALAGDVPGYTGGLLGRHPSASRLNKLLDQAEDAHAAWREQTRLRRQWMDDVEARRHHAGMYRELGIDPERAEAFMNKAAQGQSE